MQSNVQKKIKNLFLWVFYRSGSVQIGNLESGIPNPESGSRIRIQPGSGRGHVWVRSSLGLVWSGTQRTQWTS